MIIKSEEFEIEISTGNEVYFASKTSGQIFKKWNDLEDSEKLILEILQKNVKKLIIESKTLLEAISK